MERAIDALEIPVIVAGSIGSLERIRRVVKAGASGFTVGTAVFDRAIAPSGSLEDQVLAVVNETEGRR
jgi:phosphoribosylformimino-5-aminoimidazole carboxamide ribonucleotide (ProFAR) isomerase